MKHPIKHPIKQPIIPLEQDIPMIFLRYVHDISISSWYSHHFYVIIFIKHAITHPITHPIKHPINIPSFHSGWWCHLKNMNVKNGMMKFPMENKIHVPVTTNQHWNITSSRLHRGAGASVQWYTGSKRGSSEFGASKGGVVKRYDEKQCTNVQVYKTDT